MGKISELNLVIEELRNAATVINDAADSLTEMFSTASVDESNDNAAPAEPALTLEHVRAVLADKSRSGHTAEIRALLQKYGANRLSEVEPSDYKALLADAEVLDDAT
ncbi:MAG: DNA ligase [Monoglobaceae bacterium]